MLENLGLYGFAGKVDYEDLPEAEQAALGAEFGRAHPALSGDEREFAWNEWIEQRLAVPPDQQARRWLKEVWR